MNDATMVMGKFVVFMHFIGIMIDKMEKRALMCIGNRGQNHCHFH